MRSAGFPCRTIGCDRTFPVLDQTSMDALRAASEARTAHEIQDHAYRHVPLSEERPASAPWVKPRQERAKPAGP